MDAEGGYHDLMVSSRIETSCPEVYNIDPAVTVVYLSRREVRILYYTDLDIVLITQRHHNPSWPQDTSPTTATQLHWASPSTSSSQTEPRPTAS